MSLQAVIARIAQIDEIVSPRPPAVSTATGASGFLSALDGAGQGFGAVEAVYAWAQRTGRAVPAGPGVTPSPGDLIVWGGRHIGIVESVDPDGSIHTIEGNSSNAVTRRTYGPDGGCATGYVRLGWAPLQISG